MNRFSRRNLLKSALATAAAYAVPCEGIVPVIYTSPATNAGDDHIVSEPVKLNEGWKFHLGNADLPDKDFDFGRMSRESTYAKNGRMLAVADAKFDDTTWTPVDLPHDWAVELPFVEGAHLPDHGGKPLGREYPDTSIGWYRRSFSVSPSDAGKKVHLRFDGVFRQALVLLNGMYVGETWSGYSSYTFDVSDMLNFDSTNVLVVRVDASLGEGWFYEGAGIYRNVWLVTKAAVHMVEDSTIVRTSIERETAALTFACEVVNKTAEDQICQMSVSVRTAHSVGSPLLQARSASIKIGAGESIELAASGRLLNPKLWSPENPEMYEAEFIVHANGVAVDREHVSFGVRTFHFDADKGFFVNGVPTKIKGTCNHQDHAGVGTALPDALHVYRLGLLKQMGSNAVRTSHNPPASEFLDACDRLGMLAMAETRMMSSSPQGLEQLSTMIRRFRNHPSVFIWSLGNEEREQGTAHGERMVATMRQLVRKLDPTRPVTVAMNGKWGMGVTHSVDVQGCNYDMKDIDAFHHEHPPMPMIGTETASAVSTRGEYSNDKVHGYVSAYDINTPAWGATAEAWWKFYDARPFLSGGFAWTGFDYRGEPTPYGAPCISSHFGIMDTCGFPKDTYFYYKAWWGKEPVLHLFPHWDWHGREGQSIDVWVHSNFEEVELVVNDVSQGTKAVERNGHVQWAVPFVAGYIEARGKSGGKIILTERRETVGRPAQLRLTTDRQGLSTTDVSVVSVEVLDDKDRIVSTADNFVQFEISGPGKILGVGNGDPSCHEPDKASERSAFNGRCVAIVQTSHTPGTIHIVARSAGLKTAELDLPPV